MTGVDVITSAPLHLGKYTKKYSIFAQWSGAPNGFLKLQVSTKSPEQGDKSVPDLSDANDWTDLPNSTISIAGAAGNHLYNVVEVGYFWVRLIYTNTSSTGVLSVWAGEKE